MKIYELILNQIKLITLSLCSGDQIILLKLTRKTRYHDKRQLPRRLIVMHPCCSSSLAAPDEGGGAIKPGPAEP